MPEASRVHTQRPVRLVIFDLDGTLVDSRQDLANAVNHALQSAARPVLRLQEVTSFIGDGAKTLVERALVATGGSNAALLDRALQDFLAHYDVHKLEHTRLYPGVLTSLEQLHTASPALPMAVLTNKPVLPSRQICEALSVTPHLFQIFGGDSFAHRKPSPDGVLALLQQASHLLGEPVAPPDAVLVGDSEVDIATARAAGTRVIGCSYGFAPDALLAAGPDAVAARPEDWARQISDWL